MFMNLCTNKMRGGRQDSADELAVLVNGLSLNPTSVWIIGQHKISNIYGVPSDNWPNWQSTSEDLDQFLSNENFQQLLRQVTQDPSVVVDDFQWEYHDNTHNFCWAQHITSPALQPNVYATIIREISFMRILTFLAERQMLTTFQLVKGQQVVVKQTLDDQERYDLQMVLGL